MLHSDHLHILYLGYKDVMDLSIPHPPQAVPLPQRGRFKIDLLLWRRCPSAHTGADEVTCSTNLLQPATIMCHCEGACARGNLQPPSPIRKAFPKGEGLKYGHGDGFCVRQGHRAVPCLIAISRKMLKMIYILLEKGQYYDPNYSIKATE